MAKYHQILKEIYRPKQTFKSKQKNLKETETQREENIKMIKKRESYKQYPQSGHCINETKKGCYEKDTRMQEILKIF